MRTPELKPLLYNQIAAHIEAMIENGTLKPGQRVPSVRRMSENRGVSVATVLQAYFLLENKGVVEARPQSGFYVKASLAAGSAGEPSRSKPAKTISQFSNADFVVNLLQNGNDDSLTQLGCASPSPENYPLHSFGRIVSSIARNQPEAMNRYLMPPGYLKLRRTIARSAESYGCDLSPEEIVITVGGMEAINLAILATTQPGDIIAVESPTYYGVLQAIESFGRKTLEIATTFQDGLCLDELAKAIKTKKVKAVFATPNFSNPLGSLMSDENKSALVSMLAKNGIPLIEDDVYGDLSFEGKRPKPAKSFDKKGLVLLCSSFSKTLSPGARAGWISPGQFLEKVIQLKMMNTIATSSLSQMAIAEYLETGGYERHLRRARAAYSLQMQQHRAAVQKYFPEGTRMSRPMGGFCLWIEMPKSVQAFRMYEGAIREKISIAPGPIFSAQPAYKNFIRINCGNIFSDKIDQALLRLGRIAHSLA